MNAKKELLLDQMNGEATTYLDDIKIQSYTDSMKSLLASSSFIEQKSFLSSFIKKVELNEPQVVISYTMPILLNGLTTKEEVLRIGENWLPE